MAIKLALFLLIMFYTTFIASFLNPKICTTVLRNFLTMALLQNSPFRNPTDKKPLKNKDNFFEEIAKFAISQQRHKKKNRNILCKLLLPNYDT